MSRVLLEVCCGSADDVIEAHKAGADRVELNSDLFHGGLTPTLGELIVAKRETGMRIMAMVRPREGGFHYTEAEFATAVEDAKLLLAHGADGLVFGFLHEDGTLDGERTRVLAELAQAAGKESVFHRAIDVVPDMIAYAAGRIEILPGAGITARNMDRIITETGCGQIHLAAHREMADPSTRNNRAIFYGGCLYPPEDRFKVIDGGYIGGMVSRLKG